MSVAAPSMKRVMAPFSMWKLNVMGGYWEAGYAEGLGLPVIYTCEEGIWNEKKTHFDTNHMVTIIWNAANLDAAAANLTATIRATFRSEAKQSDD